MPPSDFQDVEDVILRNKNRGAILANIFERYVDEGTNRLLAEDFVICTREIENYLSRVPRNEKGLAKDAMMLHLEKRGFRMEGG